MDPLEILLYVVIAGLVIWRVVFRQLRGTAITGRGLTIIPGVLLLVGLESSARALPGASGGEITFLATTSQSCCSWASRGPPALASTFATATRSRRAQR